MEVTISNLENGEFGPMRWWPAGQHKEVDAKYAEVRSLDLGEIDIQTTNDKDQVYFDDDNLSITPRVYRESDGFKEDDTVDPSAFKGTIKGIFVGEGLDGPLGMLGQWTVETGVGLPDAGKSESKSREYIGVGGAVGVKLHGSFGADYAGRP